MVSVHGKHQIQSTKLSITKFSSFMMGIMFIKFQKYSMYDSEENEGGLHLPLPQLEAWTRFNIYFSLQQRKKPRGCNSSQQYLVTF